MLVYVEGDSRNNDPILITRKLDGEHKMAGKEEEEDTGSVLVLGTCVLHLEVLSSFPT